MAQIKIVEFDWEDKIRHHHGQVHHAIETLDFSFFTASAAHHLARGVNFAATLRAAPNADPGTIEHLKNLSTQSTEETQIVFDRFTTNVKEAKENDKEGWETKLRDENEKAKKKIADGLDARTDEAINRIKQLPEGQRPGAADLWSGGLNLVMTSVNFMLKKLEETFGYIVDIFKKVWTGLENAAKSVADFARGVVGKIGHFFGFGFFAANVAFIKRDGSAAVVVQIFWPGTYSQSDVQDSLEYITQEFARVGGHEESAITKKSPLFEDGIWKFAFEFRSAQPDEDRKRLHKIIDVEGARKSPIPRWPDLRTPDKVYRSLPKHLTEPEAKRPVRNGVPAGGADKAC